jgi:hypothetical protein
MNASQTPEQRAESLVTLKRKIPGGPSFILLGEGLGMPVHLGPYQSPVVAQDQAKEVRSFLAAVIRQAAAEG